MTSLAESSVRGVLRASRTRPSPLRTSSAGIISLSTQSHRHYSITNRPQAPNQTPSILGTSFGGSVPSYFSKPSLPANTIIKFVPQQTAWIVERMGKFSRILQPGLAILVPVLERIAYVKSLKEAAIEIPSQSAITADNVTLELDGVLYTRVFDAYKASYVSQNADCCICKLKSLIDMGLRIPNTQFPSSLKRPCAQKSVNSPSTTS